MSLTKKKREEIRGSYENKTKAKREKKLTEKPNHKIFKEKSEKELAKNQIVRVFDNSNLTSEIENKINDISYILDKRSKNVIKEIIKESKYVSRYYQDCNTSNLSKIIANLCTIQWIRPLNEWEKKSKSPQGLVRSLVDWCVCKYKIPNFLYNEFSKSYNDAQYLPLVWHLAQGGSMKEANKKGLLKGAFLTAKMSHLFLQAPDKSDIRYAIRYAQIKSFGGSDGIIKEICLSKITRGDSFLNDNYWISVIEWFCKQGMFDYSKVIPIIDFLELRKPDLKGRNINTVLKDVENWHTELNKKRQLKYIEYEKSGFSNWSEIDNKGFESKISEILNTKELQTEGKSMSHCVLSYQDSIIRRRTSIWSLKIANERCVTIEVNNSTKKIPQIRGKFNRKSTVSELEKIKRWATENGLSILENV